MTASHGLEYCISDLPITLSHGREGHKAHMDISCLELGKNRRFCSKVVLLDLSHLVYVSASKKRFIVTVSHPSYDFFLFVFFISCISDAKRACFSLGGFFKRNGGWTMQQCAIDCCQTRNCNTGVPTMTPAAIPVFPETGDVIFHTAFIFFQSNQVGTVLREILLSLKQLHREPI